MKKNDSRDILHSHVFLCALQLLILNWDQTALHLVPTGQWTMNKSGKKVVTICNSDDKKAVLAVTMSGEYLPPQLIYK